MEVLELITILAVLGTVCGTIIVVLNRVLPRKTVKKVAEDNITRLLRANSDLTQEYEERQKQMHKSLMAENIKLRKELEPSSDEEDEMPIPPEMLAPIAKKLNMDPTALMAFVNSPKGKQLLKQYKDLLPALPALLGGLGNGNSNNQQPNQSMF